MLVPTKLLDLALLCMLWLLAAAPVDSVSCKYFDDSALKRVVDDATVLANERRQKLLILPIFFFGLANRLRMISSLVPIAERLNKHVLALWFPSHECNSTFDALFTSTLHNATFVSFPAGGAASLAEVLEIKGNLTNFITEFQRERLSFIVATEPRAFFLQPEDAYYTSDILLFWPVTSVTTADASCADYYNNRRLLYLHLQPSPAVARVMSPYDKEIGRANGDIVGVHIRAFDSAHDWDIVTPALQSIPGDGGLTDGSLCGFDKASPLEAFLPFLVQARAARRQVFLATNSPALKRELHRLVTELSSDDSSGDDDFIMTIQSDLSDKRGDPEGILLAAAEMLLLSKCSLILHSKGSSFAQEAALMAGAPLVDVATDPAGRMAISIFGYHVALPFCGLSEFVQHGLSDHQLISSSSSSDSVDSTDVEAIASTHINDEGNSKISGFSFESDLTAAIFDGDDGREIVCFEQTDRVMCSRSAWLCPCSSTQGGADLLLALARAEALGVVGPLCWSRRGGEGCGRSAADSNGLSVLP